MTHFENSHSVSGALNEELLETFYIRACNLPGLRELACHRMTGLPW